MPHVALETQETGAAYLLLPACGEKVAGRPDEGQTRQTDKERTRQPYHRPSAFIASISRTAFSRWRSRRMMSETAASSDLSV